MLRYDVFISYNQNTDQDAAKLIAYRLRSEAGLNPWLDIWAVIPGTPEQEAQEQGLVRTECYAVLIGKGGLSGWQNEQMRMAIQMRVYENSSYRIIPVFLPDADPSERDSLPPFLARYHPVYFHNTLEDENAFQQLVNGIRSTAQRSEFYLDVEPGSYPPFIQRQSTQLDEPISLEVLKEEVERLSVSFAALESKIPGAPFISEQLQRVADQCLQPNAKHGQVVLLTGEPGSGKSMFLALLYRQLASQSFVIGIRPEDHNNDGTLPQRVEDLITKAIRFGSVVLLLDSLDKLASIGDTGLLPWLQLLHRLKLQPNTVAVAACRVFEAHHTFPLINQQWTQSLEINLPSVEWITKGLEEVGRIEPDKLSPELLTFLQVPLHLELALHIAEQGGTFTDITSLQGLYVRLFQYLGVTAEQQRVLSTVAAIMLQERQVQLPRYALPEKVSADFLGRTGLIEQNSQQIWFRHQTLRDYLLAWRAAEIGQSLVSFLEEFGQGLAIRPALWHLLLMLRPLPQRLIRALYVLFFESDQVRTHIKTGILSVIASWSDSTQVEASFLLRLFHEAPEKAQWQIQFLEHNPHPTWFLRLRDNFLIPALQGALDNVALWQATRFLVHVASSYPVEILQISLQLVQRQSPDPWLFNKISNILANLELPTEARRDYADLLVGIVERGLTWGGQETVLQCQRLAQIDPQRALHLYFNTLDNAQSEPESGIESDHPGDHFEHILPYLFDREPLAVLQASAAFLERTFRASGEDSHKRRWTIWDDPSHWLYSQSTGGIQPYYGPEVLLGWFSRALDQFIKNQPNQTFTIIEQLRTSQWYTLQHLGYLAMVIEPRNYADLLFQRTVSVFDDSKSGEQELMLRIVRTAFGVFTVEQRQALLTTVLDQESDDDYRTYHFAYAPLSQIPEEFLSDDARIALGRLTKRFGGPYTYYPRRYGSTWRWATSPVRDSELRKLTANELLEFLIGHSNLSEKWDFDTDQFVGGTRELAQEMAKVVLADLQRFQNMLLSLAQDPSHAVYINAVLRQLEPSFENVEWLIALTSQIYEISAVQSSLADTLSKAIDFLTIEQWSELEPLCVDMAANAPDPEQDEYAESTSQQDQASTVFNESDKFITLAALTQGINSTRGKVCAVLLKAASRFWNDRLQASLEQLAQDSTISVRAAFLYYLSYLEQAHDWETGFSLFRLAFDPKESELSLVGAHFMAYVPEAHFEKVKPYWDQMRPHTDGPIGQQAAILTAIYVLRNLISLEEFELLLSGEQYPLAIKQQAAEIVCNWVEAPEYLQPGVEILQRIIIRGDAEDFVKQINVAFHRFRSLDLPWVEPFIRMMIENPNRGEIMHSLLRYVELASQFHPRLAFDLLESILLLPDDETTWGSHNRARHFSTPLTILAPILSGAYPDLEERALDIFDRLIAMQWQGVDDYLCNIERS